tara:strand:+ start:14754 stop:15980 length:1227 start_codon:yes stop_codon:yes gene_type:complete
MIPENPKGVIELGNINIRCLIFQINNNTSEILSNSITQSQGIHNGVIVNLKKASDAIRKCIGDAEKKAKISLKKINVVFEQPEFLCTKFSKHKKIDGSKIHKDDIEFLLKEAKKQVTLNDEKQSIIHIFNHNYIVDGKNFIEEPIDVYADYLSHEMTFITAPKNNIRNINQAFIDCDIEVERFISSTFASAVELLNNNDLQSGSSLIDFGFEKTSLGLFKNLALVNSITFPIGINHITKDISKVCSLSIDESENIKNKIDFSFEDENVLFDESENLKKLYFKNSKFRKISKSLLNNIIKSRIEEILQMVEKQLSLTKFNSTLRTNNFISGGGSNLYNLDKYCSNFFGINFKKINYELKSVGNLDENYSSCLGALKIIKDGWETEAIPELKNRYSDKIGFLAKIFGNLR